MEKTELSVIIPHYNSPKLLEHLLQTIPDNEIQIIVVDDNSTEEIESFNKVKEIYSGKVEFYSNDSGVQSAGACRNIGLDHAKGKWVMFADADDFFLPGMYDIVKQYFDKEYDLVVFVPTSVILGTDQTSDRHEHMASVIDNYKKNPTRENYLLMSTFDINYPWSKLFRREVIVNNQIRFSQSLHWNDMLFSTKFGYYCKKAEASYEKIYCITKMSGSLTTNMSEKAFDSRLDEQIKKCVFLRERYEKRLCDRLHITGAAVFYMAVQQGYGIKKYIQIIRRYHKNGVPIITLRGYSPFHIAKMIFHSKNKEKRNRKYYVYK